VSDSVDRSDWPIRVYRLGEEPADDLRDTTTAAERLAMVWELTQEAWKLANREIPDYPPEKAPIRVVRSSVRARQEESS
jgi:hypothetical protein